MVGWEFVAHWELRDDVVIKGVEVGRVIAFLLRFFHAATVQKIRWEWGLEGD